MRPPSGNLNQDSSLHDQIEENKHRLRGEKLYKTETPGSWRDVNMAWYRPPGLETLDPARRFQGDAFTKVVHFVQQRPASIMTKGELGIQEAQANEWGWTRVWREWDSYVSGGIRLPVPNSNLID